MNKTKLYFILLIFLALSCDDNIESNPTCDNGAHLGNVTLKTQQEVDDFGAMCYSSIHGNLKIYSDTEIDNISALLSLTEVTGLTSIDVPLLSSLDGLQNLERLGHHFTLRGLDNVETLHELSNLQHAEMSIQLIELPLIQNLQGLENLTYSKSIRIMDCPSLTSMDALNNIENSIWSRVDLYNCPLIESLEVFQRIEYIGNITINGMDGLQSLQGFNNISEAHNISIKANKNLITLSGLDKLTNTRFLSIQSNNSLENLNGLENLTTTSYVDIGRSQYNTNNGNPILSNFCALQNLFGYGTYNNVYIENNAFNPSIPNITQGNCSQ